MEKKKGTKMSLPTFFLFLGIIVIIVMACYMYLEKTKSYKVSDDKNKNSSSNQYLDITKELNENELFKITKAIDNNDGTFTLMGKLYIPYIISESELSEILNNGTLEYNNTKLIIKNGKNQGTYALCPE